MNGKLHVVLAYVASGLAALFGGFCPLLKGLALLAVCDWIAGASARYIKRQPWDWRKGYEGVLKKFILYPCAIVVAVAVDQIMAAQGVETGGVFRKGMLLVLLGKELVSLLGHLKTCDIPILKSLLDLAENWRAGKIEGKG